MTAGPESADPPGGPRVVPVPFDGGALRLADEGFPRRFRLLRPEEFTAVFDHGSRKVGRCMVMWTRSAEGPEVRLGVVTSKRAFHRAVDRNLIRRRFRECFRKNRTRFRAGVEMVLVGRTAALDVPFNLVEKEMLALAGRAGLIAGRTLGER